MDKFLFWIMAVLIIYTYAGYGALIGLAGWIKYLVHPETKMEKIDYEPEVTLVIACYDEDFWIEKKIQNTLNLDYPSEKVSQVWVIDDSSCSCAGIFAKYPQIKLIQQAERRGKSAAINLGMISVKTDIVVFSDANAMLSPNSLRELVKRFRNPRVGCVAGEKRIQGHSNENTAGAGESIYWRYESGLKSLETKIGSAISAAGEFFAIRRHLFTPLQTDSLIEDFIISARIAFAGYKIDYSPQAFALETASANLKEEWKRKTRIAAGALQALIRLPRMLNPFKNPMFTFQYVSHKFLRSFCIPFFLIALFPLNFHIVIQSGVSFDLFTMALGLQIIFYTAAGFGFLMEKFGKSCFVFSFPCYFVMMNLACMVGFFKYVTGKQSVKWDKAKRTPDLP